MDTVNNNFTNEVINTASLPKFEEASLTPLHPAYKKIMLINISIAYSIIIIIAGLALYFFEEAREFWIAGLAVYALLITLSVLLAGISFKNRGFAFRD